MSHWLLTELPSNATKWSVEVSHSNNFFDAMKWSDAGHGNTLYCLPQDCLLVGNSEVGNIRGHRIFGRESRES